MNKIFRYLFIGILFPLLVQFVFYFQFTSNYTQDLFSEQKFRQFYGSGVYQSRQLGRSLHLWVYQQLSGMDKMQEMKVNPYNSRRLRHLDEEADPVFYLSYFFIATFFMVLTSLLLLLLFERKEDFSIDKKFRDLLALFLILMMGMTQFVVTPYDTPGYFLQTAALIFFLNYLRSGGLLSFILLLLTIFIATLNRETSLLILSFMAAVYFGKEGIRIDWIKRMILPVLCFALPYLYLKFSGEGSSFTDASLLAINLDLGNAYALLGLAFAAMMVYLAYRMNHNSPSLVTAYFLFSLPYILIIFVVGITQEFRLWMPLVHGALILGILNLPEFRTSTVHR
jgi:hypothetical protein